MKAEDGFLTINILVQKEDLKRKEGDEIELGRK